MTGEQSDHTLDSEPGGPPSASGITRKKLLKAAVVAAPAPFLVGALPALAGDRTPSGQSLDPTPSCDDGDDPTPPQTEGPYFKPNSPQRTSMLDGNGTRLVLTGTVYGLACQPIANALLDFWQADANGAYDNTGFRFRGHQYTNSQGTFSLTTIVPGLYPGRTRHIHVKVQAPGNAILTSQLYFPGEPRNATDPLYNPALLMAIQDAGTERRASFDFVLNVNQTPGPTPTSTGTPPSGTWQPGVSYSIGAQVSYNGLNYRCRIAHTSMVGWEPPNVAALWQRI